MNKTPSCAVHCSTCPNITIDSVCPIHHIIRKLHINRKRRCSKHPHSIIYALEKAFQSARKSASALSVLSDNLPTLKLPTPQNVIASRRRGNLILLIINFFKKIIRACPAFACKGGVIRGKKQTMTQIKDSQLLLLVKHDNFYLAPKFEIIRIGKTTTYLLRDHKNKLPIVLEKSEIKRIFDELKVNDPQFFQ